MWVKLGAQWLRELRLKPFFTLTTPLYMRTLARNPKNKKVKTFYTILLQWSWTYKTNYNPTPCILLHVTSSVHRTSIDISIEVPNLTWWPLRFSNSGHRACPILDFLMLSKSSNKTSKFSKDGWTHLRMQKIYSLGKVTSFVFLFFFVFVFVLFFHAKNVINIQSKSPLGVTG